MRKVLIVLFVLVLIVAGGATAAAWRYDESRSNRLAEGISIAGVDVGGLRVVEARAALERRVQARLVRPLVVRYKHGQFVFDPSRAEVETNIDSLLGDALERSREGNFLTRALRDATGGRLGEQMALHVSFSEGAVQKFVRGIRKTVERKPHEAKSEASFAGVRITPSHDGVAVKTGVLTRRIDNALVAPDASRTLRLPTKILHPKTTTKELQKKFRYFIAVSRSRKELRWFVNEKLVKTYTVAIGRVGFETPAGLYEIQSKAVNPAWYVPKEAWAGDLAGKIIPPGDPENPLKARWMGFYDGAGIHGTAEDDSIGSAASHGCIRMHVPDVIDLYRRVPLHTPLFIS